LIRRERDLEVEALLALLKTVVIERLKDPGEGKWAGELVAHEEVPVLSLNI
jgi:hypothetical protein